MLPKVQALLQQQIQILGGCRYALCAQFCCDLVWSDLHKLFWVFRCVTLGLPVTLVSPITPVTLLLHILFPLLSIVFSPVTPQEQERTDSESA